MAGEDPYSSDPGAKKTSIFQAAGREYFNSGGTIESTQVSLSGISEGLRRGWVGREMRWVLEASRARLPCRRRASQQTFSDGDEGGIWSSWMRRLENWRPSFRGVMRILHGPTVQRARNSTGDGVS